MTNYNVSVGMFGGGTLRPTGWYDVRAYGAVGDGVTDDTSAIQAAADAAVSGRGTLFFPRGTYITGKVDIGGSIDIVGSGAGEYPTNTYYGTVLKMPNGGAEGLAVSAIFYFSARAEQCKITDMTILVNQYGHATTQTIHYAYGADRCMIRNLQIVGWTNSGAYDRVGVRIDGEDPDTNTTNSYNNIIQDCFIYGMNYGVHLNGSAAVGKYLNNNTIRNCTFDGIEGACIRIDDGTDVKIMDNNLNGNPNMPTAYVEVDGPISTIVSQGNYFDEVGSGGNPAITYSVTGFTNGNLACPIVSLGDNQPPTTFSLNSGQVIYNGKYLTGAILYGSGDPESNIISGVGTVYLRSDGGSGTTLYVKESGTGNTGWVAK